MIPIYDPIVTKGMNINIIEFERQTLSMTCTWILGILEQERFNGFLHQGEGRNVVCRKERS